MMFIKSLILLKFKTHYILNRLSKNASLEALTNVTGCGKTVLYTESFGGTVL